MQGPDDIEDQEGSDNGSAGPEIWFVLVDPIHPGNVGSIARVLKNFGLSKLAIVGDIELDDDAVKMAMHAIDIIDDHVRFSSISELKMDYLVGTTGVPSVGEKKSVRYSVPPSELVEKIGSACGKVGILFGREDQGLFNDEIKLCDLVVTIPTSEEYPIMNLSHAAAIIAYELSKAEFSVPEKILATSFEKEKLFEFFRELIDAVDLEEHRRERTELFFRRVIGRSPLTKWEFHALMGVLSDTLARLGRARPTASEVEPEDEETSS